MAKRSDREFLSDILEAIRRIQAYTDEMTFEEFLRDTKTQDAEVRNLEIIGCAFRPAYPRLRDRDFYGNVKGGVA